MINPLLYKRRLSRQVFIGGIPLGGKEKIRLQSMTNTDTSNINDTVEQIIKIAEAGADYVRITVPTSYVAERLPEIKSKLKEYRKNIPLIADIHFSPKAAEISAKYVEKVRINPGNYIDKKQFKHINYSDDEYFSELDRIKENILPLIDVCKKHNTAVRIGTNHGSLSDRIMSRYGDTPLGMVESTMEFLRVFKEENFNDIVISMKASNPIVMIHAVRLLVDTMDKESMDYPLHLGVTEAGNDNEGRIKSAVGIGSLLVDGIGDTIRVSLTESPEKEIPVAKYISDLFNHQLLEKFIPINLEIVSDYDAFSYKRRQTVGIKNIGGNNVPVVIADSSENIDKHCLINCGFEYEADKKEYLKNDSSADYIFTGNKDIPDYFKAGVETIQTQNIENANNINSNSDFSIIRYLEFNSEDIYNFDFKTLNNFNDIVLILNLTNAISPIHAGRTFFLLLDKTACKLPVILKFESQLISEKEVTEISAKAGSLMIDGFGDGIWIKTCNEYLKHAVELSFGILQACRTRITMTDYISCPSCGRTLFNLEETTARIKEKTTHLKGIKIAIMGCIVNGPGEMADADFGYVGTGKGKVTLYRKQDVVKRNIPEEEALDELLKLIEQFY